MVERRYWDSDCFLGWLQDEPGKVDPCGTVLALCERREAEIVTSTLTIAEVLMLRPKDALPRERRDKVRSLFAKEYIHTVPLIRRIAEAAQDLYWDYGIAPKDAAHVATAIAARAEVLNTFDKGLIGKSGQIGSPPLQIAQPFVDSPELGLAGRHPQTPA